jgi:hypothetical protein
VWTQIIQTCLVASGVRKVERGFIRQHMLTHVEVRGVCVEEG